jgi:UDP-glucuronate 4-epimerase
MSKQHSSKTHFLVTGALGCLGSWVVRNLVKDGVAVTAFDLGSDPYRMKLMMSPDEVNAVRFVNGDIADLAALEAVIAGHGVTDVIHLAALQVPACKANPSLGARVNVVGTINVFEAARKAGLKRVVYASSVAVYGLREEYAALIQHDDPLRPRTLYGAYKQANEATARIYAWDYGLSSIGLRPYVIYGPGRDQGMTSTPTKAMLAVAAGQPYHITYGGRCGLQYVDDVARMFIEAARAPFEGAEVYNIRGSVVDMTEVIAAIEAAEPAARGTVTFESSPLPFPDGQDDGALQELLGGVSYTPLKEGVARTIALFKEALAAGKLSSE